MDRWYSDSALAQCARGSGIEPRSFCFSFCPLFLCLFLLPLPAAARRRGPPFVFLLFLWEARLGFWESFGFGGRIGSHTDPAFSLLSPKGVSDLRAFHVLV